MNSVNASLIQAAKLGRAPVIRALFLHPECDASTKDDQGMTALMWASHGGHEACVGLLLPASDALAKDRGGMTPLMWAAHHGCDACVSLLIPASDARAKNSRRMTALMMAAYKGQASCVHALLGASDSVAKSPEWEKASSLASTHGHADIARMIDARALSIREQKTLSSVSRPGSPRTHSALRTPLMINRRHNKDKRCKMIGVIPLEAKKPAHP